MKWTTALIAVLAFAAASCQQPASPIIDRGELALNATDSATYLDEISSRASVTEAEALRGVLLLLGREEQTTFSEAVTFLTERGVASPAWGFQADRPVTRSKIAYMIYQACDVPGGLTLTLTGPSRRYCLRELQYRGLMAPGLADNPVTGMEYVAILARADELRQTGKVSDVMLRERGYAQ